MAPAYGNWLQTVCQHAGFKPRIVREADGAASALALVGAGFGVAWSASRSKSFPREGLFSKIWWRRDL
jgi:hypothetical protein